MTMGRRPDFIGLGAQRSGTSWIYACLYEHPEIYAPVKEVHFFSRGRNWVKGYKWYENIFDGCSCNAKAGEFSTSYLCDPDAPQRIHRIYPDSRLIVSLRNPMDRAYSNYMNDIMAGVVSSSTPFEEVLACHPEYLEHGYYARYLERYLQHVDREQILILIYDDSRKDPCAFIQSIYRFIGVDDGFVPSMLFSEVNVGRIPRSVRFDRLLDKVSALLRRKGLRKLWWLGKNAGIGNSLRQLNTSGPVERGPGLDPSTRRRLLSLFEGDIQVLEEMVGRDLQEWRK